MAAATRRQYKGAAASTTTSSSLTNIATSVTLTAVTGWPTTASVPFYVVIEPGTASEEKCSATISGSTLTLTRAQDDTTGVAHSSGSTIYPVFTADEADEANLVASVIDVTGGTIQTMPATSQTIVGRTTTDTLTNKTLGSGTIATTQAANDNSTKVSTTAYVATAVAASTPAGDSDQTVLGVQVFS